MQLQNTRKKMARDNEVRDAQIQKLKKDLEIQQAQFNDREKEFAAEMKKVRTVNIYVARTKSW